MEDYYVAPSYVNLATVGDVFEKDGKHYIKVILKSGKEKEVRAYEAKEEKSSIDFSKVTHVFYDEYKELALHSKAYWLGVFLVAQVAVPTFTNVMSDYISNELQAKNGDEIDFNVIIEKKNDSNIKVTYRGDAEHINSVLDKVNELSRDKEIDKSTK